MKIKTFAERLDEALKLRNMKSADVVSASHGKLDKPSMSQWLSGKYNAKQDKLTILANVLHVNESWLMGYDVDMKPISKGIKIPVLGHVAAGIPMEAIENIVDYEEIDEELAKKGDMFGLIIKGDSMFPYILDKDVLIVKKQDDCESGDIAIVRVNGDEVTVKKIHKREDGSITLIPFNPIFQQVTYSPEQIEKLPVKVIGIFAELRRKKFN